MGRPAGETISALRPAITPVTVADAFTTWGSEERRKRYRDEFLAEMTGPKAAYFGIAARDLAPGEDEQNVPAHFPELLRLLDSEYERAGERRGRPALQATGAVGRASSTSCREFARGSGGMRAGSAPPVSALTMDIARTASAEVLAEPREAPARMRPGGSPCPPAAGSRTRTRFRIPAVAWAGGRFPSVAGQSPGLVRGDMALRASARRVSASCRSPRPEAFTGCGKRYAARSFRRKNAPRNPFFRSVQDRSKRGKGRRSTRCIGQLRQPRRRRALYRERMGHVFPHDYPVLFWMKPLIPDVRRIFDLGGHVGITELHVRALPRRLRERRVDRLRRTLGGQKRGRRIASSTQPAGPLVHDALRGRERRRPRALRLRSPPGTLAAGSWRSSSLACHVPPRLSLHQSSAHHGRAHVLHAQQHTDRDLSVPRRERTEESVASITRQGYRRDRLLVGAGEEVHHPPLSRPKRRRVPGLLLPAGQAVDRPRRGGAAAGEDRKRGASRVRPVRRRLPCSRGSSGAPSHHA